MHWSTKCIVEALRKVWSDAPHLRSMRALTQTVKLVTPTNHASQILGLASVLSTIPFQKGRGDAVATVLHA